MNDTAPSLVEDVLHDAYEVVGGRLARGVILVCDHATNAMPAEFDHLGLPPEQLMRHIAWDIGAEDTVRAMAAALGAPAVLSRFSRLLVDPNRGDDDPTLVRSISDGVVIPGNAGLDASGIAARRHRFAEPYHAAIADMIDRALAADIVPALVSLHSFTPVMQGRPRPWHVGILWDADPRLNVPLIQRLREERDLVVGDNEPYDGALEGDTIDRHATRRGLANTLIELRQDLIAHQVDARRWGERLALMLAPILARPETHHIADFGSRCRRPAATTAGVTS